VGPGRGRARRDGRHHSRTRRLTVAAAGAAVRQGDDRPLRREHHGPEVLLAPRRRLGRHPPRRVPDGVVERAGLRALPAGRVARRRVVGSHHGGRRTVRSEGRTHLVDPTV
jgi:hypothetical protein